MTDVDPVQTFLVDAFDRIRGQAADLIDGLSADVADFRPDSEANPIGWLLWHVARVTDDHVAGLAEVEQVWPRWRDRFDLPLADGDIGYGHTAAQVATVGVSADLLAGYHAEVHELVSRYLDHVDAEELGRVVDTHWDPPVTVSVRLVSVVSDALQHLGQAAYVRGLAERRA